MRALLLFALSLTVAPQSAPAQAPPAPPAHVIAVYADLDSTAALRAFVVLRTFAELHPGAAVVEIHVNPPDGRARAVDRAAIAARSLNAALPMAELIAINHGQRTDDDFAGMVRQLGLDQAQFRKALDADGDAAVAEDVAAASKLKLPRDVAVVIDGEPLRVPVTLTELEARLIRSPG
jgi:hypothetical protein